jgi:hypothetical protein
MKHSCVTARIGPDFVARLAHILDMSCAALRVSADSGCNPLKGLDMPRHCRGGAILAGGGVAALANIRDIHRGLLLASSQNRVSASRVSQYVRRGALKPQVQHFLEKMLHGKNLRSIEY